MGLVRRILLAILEFLETPVDESLSLWYEQAVGLVRTSRIRKNKVNKVIFKKPILTKKPLHQAKAKLTKPPKMVKKVNLVDREVRRKFFWMRVRSAFVGFFIRFNLISALRHKEFKRKVKLWEKRLHKQTVQQTKFKLKNGKWVKRKLTAEERFDRDNLRFSFRAAFSIIFTVGIIYGSYFVYQVVFVGLPDVSLLASAHQNVTTKIYDRNHHLLFSIYEDENRTPVPLSAISPYLIQATIAIEDQKFYEHEGFDVQGIIRAYFVNQEEGAYRQGGSTITQQLVKKRLLSSEKTIIRKAKELVLAILAEGNYSKDQILEMYLNEINYGGAIYGIEQAAVSYFGKNARNLDLAESSFLAAIPVSPSYFAPFANHMDETKERQKEVLRRMVEDGFISQDEANMAAAEELAFIESTINIEAPHFVMYVRELLAQQYGEEMVSKGGLEVVTTLDLAMQKKMEEIVAIEVNNLAAMRINNGAAMMTNPQTGEILAMVGSRNYFDAKNDGMVNVCLRPRQPGSSIKPLTYALALENGYTPASIIEDQPVVYQPQGGRPYAPKNYDGQYHGRVTLRESLGSSYNIPAVKLLNELGVNKLIDQGEKMGVTTWEDRTRFGLSLTLGGGDVRMIDLTKIYGAFANGGYTMEQNPILSVRDSKGKTLYENECATAGADCDRERTISAQTAYQITNILSDNNARIPAFGAQSVLNIPGQEVAVKTGTTNNLRDNWTVGYTSDRLVAVWVGNNDNTPMSYVASGITGASPIWSNILKLTLNSEIAHSFVRPDGLNAVQICAKTGSTYCGGCQPMTEYFKPGTEPTIACRMPMPAIPSQNLSAEVTPTPASSLRR